LTRKTPKPKDTNVRKKLTAAALDSLPEGEYFDTILPGLSFKVGVHRRTWTYRYSLGGARKADRVGHYPSLGLAAARDAAAEIARRVDAGLPVAQPKPVEHPSAALSLDGLLTRYTKVRKREGGKIKMLDRSMTFLRHLLRDYLNVPVDQFTKRDLRAVRDETIERGAPMAANALLRNLSPVYRWAAEEDIVPTNFVRDIRRSPEKARNRVLTPDEIRAIWRASDPETVFGRLTRYLMLVGCRRSEAAGMQFGDVLDGVWIQTENKSDRPHALPLPPAALALLGTGTAREYPFPGVDGGLKAFAKQKAKLDKASGVTGWTLHDCRRTLVTGLDELGVDDRTIGLVVNHAVTLPDLPQEPGLKTLKKHYMLATRLNQKRDALQLWADHVAGIVEAKAARA